MMSLCFMVRDALSPRAPLLMEAGIAPSMCVLDFGCGPGSYVISAGRLVGAEGMVYALDKNPAAIESIRRRAARAGLANVRTILSDRATDLPDNSIDLALLYDTLHHLDDAGEVLAELHRVLKPAGMLSVSDHHMERDALCAAVSAGGLFFFTADRLRSISFALRQLP